MELYFKTFWSSPVDWLIVVTGLCLFFVQTWFFVGHLFRKRFAYVQNLKKWQETFLVIAELLPLLGLLGTVYSLMQTFGTFQAFKAGAKVDLSLMIQNFAPALSTTFSGLILVIPNLFINALLFNAAKVFETEDSRK